MNRYATKASKLSTAEEFASALRWEEIRSFFLERIGRHHQAEEARAKAQIWQRRMEDAA